MKTQSNPQIPIDLSCYPGLNLKDFQEKLSRQQNWELLSNFWETQFRGVAAGYICEPVHVPVLRSRRVASVISDLLLIVHSGFHAERVFVLQASQQSSLIIV